jgi:beta-phosphoglucomutase-like phosphatase (HAD superfamily)
MGHHLGYDGVIVQSAKLHYTALKQVFAARGYPYEWDVFISQFGRNNKSIVRDVIPPPPRKKWIRWTAN